MSGVIPTEARWWLENQNRLQRVQISQALLSPADYELLTQGIWQFLGTWPRIPSPQYQSPTFPSTQPVVVAWTVAGQSTNSFPGVSQQVSAVGLPTNFFPCMVGDPLVATIQNPPKAVWVQWTQQGISQGQVCDANAGQLAIALADSVTVTVLGVQSEADDGVPWLISVYPGRGITTATITTVPQSMHNSDGGGGLLSAIIPTETWARVSRWRWFWAVEDSFVPPAVATLEVTVTTPGGQFLARWFETASGVSPTATGNSPLLAFDRWEPWLGAGAFAMRLRPTGGDIAYAIVQAEIRTEV
jgi:hypothetical protein